MHIPHFDQWLGVWAIREEDFHAGYQWFQGLDLHVHLQTAGAETIRQSADVPKADIRDGVEVIGLYGSLMKQQASMSRSTSTVMARRRLRAAGRNPDVNAILLHIESPGGTAAGTNELAADIAALAQQKPVYAFIEDLGASAAYWAASQATKIFANPTAIVGSIGTYGVVYDYSQAAAKDGVRVHVIRAGEMKGAGIPGTEITAEQLAEQQKIVTGLNEFFIRGVKAGRKLSLEQTRELADGRVYVGQAAVDRKLIDGVQSLDDTFQQLAAQGRSRAAKRSSQMSVEMNAEASALTPESTTQPTATAIDVAAGGNSAPPAQAGAASPAAPAARPATLAELKAACDGASNDFLVGQMEANATIAQATTAYMAHLKSQNAALSKQVTENTIAASAAPLRKPGAAPVPAGAGSSPSTAVTTGGDVIAQWDEAVQTLMTDRKLTKAKAVHQLCIEQPDLRKAYTAAYTNVHADQVNQARG